MTNKITRRHFLNGTQIAIGASLASPWIKAFGKDIGDFSLSQDYYPPIKTGLRGSHDGSWETMHERVMGETWNVDDVSEDYDLVIVGGGISGLSSAYFYQRENPNAKILILENHDDFGGHAKRNEFKIGNTTKIGYGGTEAIEGPSSFSEEAIQMLNEIGIDLEKLHAAYHQDFSETHGLSKGILFDEEHFGKRKLVVGYGKKPWDEFVAEAPLNEQAKKDFHRIQTEEKDYLPGLSYEEKYKKLNKVSYEAFLRDYAKVDEQVIDIYRRWGMSTPCVGIDEIPTTRISSGYGYPGVKHTLVRPRRHSGNASHGIYHFPDGNATIARLLARTLIPGSLSGSNMEDIVTATTDYSKLDQNNNNVRIRLNSTVVEAKNVENTSAVNITYVRAGKTYKVRARKAIMACFNSAIPYLCPELSEKQKAGLSYGVKTPLTYTKILIPNWRSFADLGLDFVYYTKAFYKQVELEIPVTIGNYGPAKTPDDPMILHMCYSPYVDDVKGPDQWRVGRNRMLAMPFEEFEENAKNQLDQVLGSAGFDVDRDIRAITVNRWPHGYSYRPSLLWEPEWKSEEEKPWVIGRQTFGNIAIANTDAGAEDRGTRAAIEQAFRAVNEIL